MRDGFDTDWREGIAVTLAMAAAVVLAAIAIWADIVRGGDDER